MTDDDLKRIEAYCEKATPGPWYVHINEPFAMIGDDETMFDCDLLSYDNEHRAKENAEFACRARTDLPLILADYRRLRAENEQLKEAARFRDEFKIKDGQ